MGRGEWNLIPWAKLTLVVTHSIPLSVEHVREANINHRNPPITFVQIFWYVRNHLSPGQVDIRLMLIVDAVFDYELRSHYLNQ